MRFMIMHKNDPQTEAGQPPPPELVARMGAFIGEYAQSGRFVDGAGLSGSKHRTRLVFRGGRCTIKHGPYAGQHELPSSVLQLKVATREQAIGWAERYGKVLGDGELELGKVNEPWDIGLMPMPERSTAPATRCCAARQRSSFWRTAATRASLVSSRRFICSPPSAIRIS